MAGPEHETAPEHQPLAEDDSEAAAGVVATSSPLEFLTPEWLALHAAVPGASPFLHPAWHATWLRHYGDGIEPVFLAFREDERLIGVATLDASAGALRELGDTDVRDYGGPLALPGYEAAVADTLIEWLMEDFSDEVTLWGLREGSALHSALQAAATAHGWTADERDEAVSPALELPATWDEYLAALSKHDRHELRRKLRRLEGAGEVRYESVADLSAVSSNFGTLLAQMHASSHNKARFLTRTREAFFRDLASTFTDLGLMRLGVLRFDGAHVATLLTFEDTDTLYLYNSGYDPACEHLSVGLLSKALAIRDAINRGKRRYDFLRGDEPYKRHLGGQPNRVVQLRLHR